PHDEVEMFGEEYGQQKRPALDDRWFAVRTWVAVAEHVDEGGARDAAHPRQETQALKPGTYGVRAQWNRPATFHADFEKIRTELDPVIGQEGDRNKWPDGGEES